MNSKFSGLALSATLALAALGASTADAAIINIDATGGATSYTFAAGDYLIQWIGVADGGAYDAWNPSCPTGACTSGWRNAFATTTDTGLNPEFTNYIIPGGAYASALASLAAFKASPSVIANDFAWNGVAYAIVDSETISQPWIVHIAAPVTVAFFIPDATKADNYGGVSLKVTAAVPEPATWATMILGLGMAGAVMRRRRALVAA